MQDSKELEMACFVLKARMSNEAAVQRYLNKDSWYQNQWKDFAKSVWTRPKKA